MSGTSKSRIAEQVQRMLNGGTPSRDNQISIRELIIAVEQVYAQAVKLNIFNNKRDGETESDGSFIFTFENVDVKKDNNKNLFYSILPASKVALPNDAGIVSVSYMKDQTNAFVRVPSNWLMLSKNLPMANLQNQVGFWVEGNRLYYSNITASDELCEVLVKMLVGIDGVGDLDIINVPLDIQADIVRIVFQMYSPEKQIPKDMLNNNVK